MTKKLQRKGPEPCPQCGSLDIVPIMYGLPGPEAMEAAEQGKIALGGCCVSDHDPQKQCKACGAQFDFQPLQDSRQRRRETRT
jgi:hypothetical protein